MTQASRNPERFLRQLHSFVDLLRRNDVRVSPQELVDACDALLLLGQDGIQSRAGLHAVLAATLLKNPADSEVFQRVFELCFAFSLENSASGPRLTDAWARRGLDALPPGWLDDLAHGPIKDFLAGDDAALTALVRAELEAHDLSGLTSTLQAGWYAQRLFAALLDRTRAGVSGVRSALAATSQTGAEAVIHEVEEGLRRLARGAVSLELEKRTARRRPPRGVLDRDLRAFDEAELAEARGLLRRLAERFRARARRRDRRHRRGRLDVRRTLRRSIVTDGVPFEPRLRRRRRERADLIVLCDVSDSVRHASLFMLEIASVLHDCFRTTRSFVFVDRLVEVSALLAGPQGALRVLHSDACAQGGSSDYGKVFSAFHDGVGATLGRRSVVVVLGDGRSNYRPPQEAAMASVRTRARSVIWLVPEDRGTWGFGDSVIWRYARHADAMIPVRTLRDLAAAIRRLLAL